MPSAYDSAAMLPPLPDFVDVDRAAAAGRVYSGSLPLAQFTRLEGLLVDAEGVVTYRLQFERNALGQKQVRVDAQAALPLLCQASLERFEHPVQVQATLGFVTDEEQEAALPEGVEPCLIEDGRVDPRALIEDELVLMVPVVARNPGAPVHRLSSLPPEAEAVEQKANPFAALASLKRQ